jgi:hypothetical protein
MSFQGQKFGNRRNVLLPEQWSAQFNSKPRRSLLMDARRDLSDSRARAALDYLSRAIGLEFPRCGPS